jgi:antitoxin Xre/MbcA/ParS-like protein
MDQHGLGVIDTEPMPEEKQHQNGADGLRDMIINEFPNGVEWLHSPNMWLRGRTPEQTLADGDLEEIRELLDSILYVGMV